MWVVSSPYGVTLVFPDCGSLQHTLWKLQDLLEKANSGELQPPFLYHQHEMHVPSDEVDAWTDWLKWAFTEGKEE